MSTSIRPGGPVAPGPASVTEPSVTGPSETAVATDVAAVDVSRAASTVAPTQTGAIASPTAAMLSRLDAGEVTREQAIEGLVAEALETHGGARLPPAQRAELEAVLRSALADDPALSSLLG